MWFDSMEHSALCMIFSYVLQGDVLSYLEWQQSEVHVPTYYSECISVSMMPVIPSWSGSKCETLEWSQGMSQCKRPRLSMTPRELRTHVLLFVLLLNRRFWSYFLVMLALYWNLPLLSSQYCWLVQPRTAPGGNKRNIWFNSVLSPCYPHTERENQLNQAFPPLTKKSPCEKKEAESSIAWQCSFFCLCWEMCHRTPYTPTYYLEWEKRVDARTFSRL